MSDDKPTVAASPYKQWVAGDPLVGDAADAARVEHVPPPTAAKPERSLPQPIGHVMQFFKFEHLPAHLREVSQPFGELAAWLVLHCPHNPELTVALRKLLEGRDAAVRAVIAG